MGSGPASHQLAGDMQLKWETDLVVSPGVLGTFVTAV